MSWGYIGNIVAGPGVVPPHFPAPPLPSLNQVAYDQIRWSHFPSQDVSPCFLVAGP